MDIVTKREILEDYINHSYGKYFRYFIKNNIDFDDDSNPLVRNFNMLHKMLYEEGRKCETDKEFSDMEKRVDELDKFFTDYTTKAQP